MPSAAALTMKYLIGKLFQRYDIHHHKGDHDGNTNKSAQLMLRTHGPGWRQRTLRGERDRFRPHQGRRPGPCPFSLQSFPELAMLGASGIDDRTAETNGLEAAKRKESPADPGQHESVDISH